MTPIEMLRSVAYLGLLLWSGLAVVPWLAPDLSLLETFGWSACFGPAITAFILIALSMFGHAPSVLELGAIFVPGCISVIGRWKVLFSKTLLSKQTNRTSPWWTTATFIVVAYGTIFIARDAFFSPAVAWDAFNFWQLKAKVLAHRALVPTPDYFFNRNFSFSHLRYPLLVPMISAGAMAAAGNADGIGKPPDVLLYVGMCAAIFAALRRMHGPVIAALTTILLAASASFMNYAGSGTAEMTLTALYAMSLICLLRWLENQRCADLVLTALAAAAMAWTKNEGLAMAAINALVVMIFTPRPFQRRHLLAVLYFAVLVGAMYLPWAVYSYDFPRTDEDYATHLTISQIAAGLNRLPKALNGFFNEMTNLRHWAGLWIVLAMTAILAAGRLSQRTISALWTALLLQIGVLTLAYMVSMFTLDELLPLTIERLVLHMTPAAALLIGYQWQAATNEQQT